MIMLVGVLGLVLLIILIWQIAKDSGDFLMALGQPEGSALNVPVRDCFRERGCKSVIADPARDRTLETAFEGLRASAKAGQCSWGIWKKAKWGRLVWKELFETEGPERDLPDAIELKPALCEALADGEWRFRELFDYGDNEMAAVWIKTEPDTGFRGRLVMYARRRAPEHPYEVTSWSTYARLYLGPAEIRKILTTDR
jgi:hypothetical protein